MKGSAQDLDNLDNHDNPMQADSSSPPQLKRVHMGCGQTYLEGWINCDGGPSTRLFSALPSPLRSLLLQSAILGKGQRSFWRFLDSHPVHYVNARKPWPFPKNSIDVIYSCHMIDCLTHSQILEFFREAFYVLRPGGQFRIAGIDLEREIQRYQQDHDLSTFLRVVSYPDPKEEGLKSRLRHALFPPTIYLAHLDFDMYRTLLQEAGFADIVRMPAGETRITHYQPVDLWQRHKESIYVEACKT